MNAKATLHVRQLRGEDAKDLRSIRLAALEAAPNAFGSTYENEVEAPNESWVERLTTSTIFGAYSDSKIVGMAGFVRRTGMKVEHKGFVWGVFVDPSARNQKIGAALMHALIDHASTVVEQITLTVVTDNLSAITLYENCGFKSYGVEPRALRSQGQYANEKLMVHFLSKEPY